MIEVSITVVGPSGALWEWTYMCSLICLMTSGRGARACDAVRSRSVRGAQAGMPPWNFTADSLGLWIWLYDMEFRMVLCYRLQNRADRTVYLVADVIGSGLMKQAR